MLPDLVQIIPEEDPDNAREKQAEQHQSHIDSAGRDRGLSMRKSAQSHVKERAEVDSVLLHTVGLHEQSAQLGDAGGRKDERGENKDPRLQVLRVIREIRKNREEAGGETGQDNDEDNNAASRRGFVKERGQSERVGGEAESHSRCPVILSAIHKQKDENDVPRSLLEEEERADHRSDDTHDNGAEQERAVPGNVPHILVETCHEQGFLHSLFSLL